MGHSVLEDRVGMEAREHFHVRVVQERVYGDREERGTQRVHQLRIHKGVGARQGKEE